MPRAKKSKDDKSDDTIDVQSAAALIQELSFWGGLDAATNSNTTTTKTTSRQKPASASSIKVALQKTNWSAAVDPATGRTYYYDKVTRKTQWEKPKELKQLEKQKKELQRIKDAEFFKEMEANLRNSLEMGELVPGEFDGFAKTNGAATAVVPVPDPTVLQQQPRVRTISGMNEQLLNELQNPAPPIPIHRLPQPLPQSLQGRPPLPTVTRPPPRSSTDTSLDLSPDDEYEDSKQPLKGVDLLEQEETAPTTTTLHVRRNTTENVDTSSAMEEQNIDATIQTVCCVLRAHILQSTHKVNGCGPSPNTVHVNLDVFNDETSTIPTLDELKEFYLEFYRRSQMEFDSIILSLIYVERLIKETNGTLMPRPNNWKSVVLSCMVLSSKVWDDLSMWNVDFSNVSVSSSILSSYSLQRINQLERAVLTCLNFAVAIPASEYAKYYYLLRNMMIRGGLLLVPSAKEKRAVERRTQRYQLDNFPRRTKSVDWNQCFDTTTNNNNYVNHYANNGGPVLQEQFIWKSLEAGTTAATTTTTATQAPIVR